MANYGSLPKDKDGSTSMSGGNADEISRTASHELAPAPTDSGLLSCRWVTTYAMLMMAAITIALASDISLAVVCMFPGNSSTTTVDSQIPWTTEQKGLVLSAYFYGLIILPIPGGYLADLVGGKLVLAVVLTIGCVSTVLVPMSVQYVWIVFTLRVILGLVNGTVNPSIQSVLNSWAPANERSRILAVTYAGTNIGSVVPFAVSGALCTVPWFGGWPLIFYVFGGVAILCLLWHLYATYDSPDVHPRITAAEKAYIQSSLPQRTKERLHIPVIPMLTSLPIWAIFLGQIVNAFGIIVQQVNIPQYLNDVLHFPIEQNGLLSALSPTGRFLATILCGYISDKMIEKRIVSTLVVRRLFIASGFLVPAACLAGIAILNESQRIIAVVLLVLCQTTTATAMITLRINITDIAPRYASVLMGVITSSIAVAGLVAPLVATLMTASGTLAEWRNVFYMLIGTYTFGTLVFMVCGSTTEQEWAMSPNDIRSGRECKPEREPLLRREVNDTNSEHSSGDVFT